MALKWIVAAALACLLALATTATAATCGTAQYLSGATCKPCDYGKVASADGTTCVTCDPGFVKFPDSNGVANAECRAATEVCGSAQYAKNGRCSPCDYGKVQNGDGTGCEACPAGEVKVPDTNGARDAVCTPATEACGTAQYAKNGRCSPCDYGRIRNDAGDGCVVCGPGTVKTPDTNGARDATCELAASRCSANQIAMNGRCSSCASGRTPNADRTACVQA